MAQNSPSYSPAPNSPLPVCRPYIALPEDDVMLQSRLQHALQVAPLNTLLCTASVILSELVCAAFRIAIVHRNARGSACADEEEHAFVYSTILHGIAGFGTLNVHEKNYLIAVGVRALTRENWHTPDTLLLSAGVTALNCGIGSE